MIRKTLMWVLAGLACQALAAFSATFDPDTTLAKTPGNTWTRINAGGVTAPPGILSYSGGWYDPDNHQFCIFGGGHWDYSGNEVWCLDITSRTWRELYPPDVVTTPLYDGGDQGAYKNHDNTRYPGALFNPAGEPIETAIPMSRHTYDSLEYIQGIGAFLWGGVTWGEYDVDWCYVCNDSWAFDFESRRWLYLYNKSSPAPEATPGAGASAYASQPGLLYAKVTDQTWAYDPRRNRWSQVTTKGKPPYTIEGTLEYDSKRNALYFFGGNYEANLTLWRFDIESRRWSQLQPSGSGPDGGATNGPGLAYDTGNDVLLVYYSGTIWAYDPQDNSWQTRRPEIRPANTDYVFGRFRYDPVNKGVWLHGWENDQHTTWFFRYER